MILPLLTAAALAQTTAPASTQASDGSALVTLDLPAEGVEVRTLADVVSRRLGIPILYDETINNKKVILRVPNKVPESALLGILQSALRMKQMAMVDADQPGWKQIVASQNLAAVAKAGAPPTTQSAAAAVTEVFTLKRADPTRVVEAIRPMLTQPGGNAQPVPGQKILIVSDYAATVQNIGRMIQTIDTEGPGMQVQFVPLHEAEAAAVATAVTALLTSRESFLFGGAGPGVFLTSDERSNTILVLAPPDRMKEVTDLIAGLDRPVELTTKVYRLRAVSPERIDRLIKDLLGSAAKRIYQSSVDRDSQSLVVSATPAIHERIATLLKELDVPATAEQSPIRFYKLKNTKASDVLSTISSLLGEQGTDNSRGEMTSESAAVSGGIETTTTQESLQAQQMQPPGRRLAAAAPSATPPLAGLAVPNQPNQPQPSTNAPAANPPVAAQTTTLNTPPGSTAGGQFVQPFNRFGTTGGLSNGGLATSTAQNVQGIRTPNATVTADVNTNSIIVIAPPSVQAMYEELIRKLDERRPQVQIECTIVTLDTSNGWSFGVDIGKQGGFGNNNSLISFSSFGIAKVDPASGRLAPIDAAGGTFALLSPGIADVVLRALASSSRARLVSAPQLLINDNNKGQLHSVAVEPFAEILTNATQSITGSGGEAQAGTTIQVEPHISQDDYLQLDYSIELSNFTGQARSGLPPPRQENQVSSSVTIPDGFTIVVGGLSVKNARNAVDSLPIIGDIPIIGWLIGSRSASTTDTTLFVFIRPVILRDDKFEDLKYLSDRKLHEASLPPDFPQSQPIPLH